MHIRRDSKDAFIDLDLHSGRIFYKLHKINLIDTNTNAPVSPDVRSQRAELQSSEREHSPPRSRERSHSSADPVHASKPDIDDMVIDEADNEAIVRVRVRSVS